MAKGSSLSLRKVLLLVSMLFLTGACFAHNDNLALENAPTGDVVWFYLKLGVAHIIPFGIDHILFVIALCFLNKGLRSVLLQATAFTIAHSITLALSINGTIAFPAEVVEPLITLSIVFVAIENLFDSELKLRRLAVVFLFGLIHGVGFASVLNEVGLPRDKFFTSILSFNAGVEVGQVLVILLTYLFLIFPLSKKPWYRKRVVYPVSILIALIAFIWTIQRVFFND